MSWDTVEASPLGYEFSSGILSTILKITEQEIVMEDLRSF